MPRRASGRHALAIWVCAVLLVALPHLAAACPSCAQTSDQSGNSSWLVGVMLLLPLGTAAVVALVIRHYLRRANS